MIYDLFVSDHKSKSITKNRRCCKQWIYDYYEHSINLAATLRWKETSTALGEKDALPGYKPKLQIT